MKRRIKLKRRRNIIKIDFISVSIFFIILFVILWFYILTKQAYPILLNYASLETKKLSTIIINKAISNQINKQIDVNNIMKTSKNKNNEIISVDFNSLNVNKSLNIITNSIQMNLKLLEEGKLEKMNIEGFNENISKVEKENGIIYDIPFGVVFNSPFLEEVGPKIPVKTKIIGSVESNIETKITNYGINNAMLEVFVKVEVEQRVILPFISEEVSVSQNIPVAMKVIQGTVPKYYGSSLKESSNIFSIPIENEE